MNLRASILLLLCSPGMSATADDLGPLSDEFDDPARLADWQDLGVVEGWGTPSFELADIDITAPGRFHIVPGPLTWFNHLRGLLFFKEVTGDFVATIRLRVLSRHNPGDPTEPPNRSFSLAGLFVHGPRDITQAAPDPYTTDPVWPPGDFGSDYVANTENFVFLSYGSAGNPGVRQFEIKATRNSDSRLYYDSTGIDQDETEAWLQMVRVGDTIVCLRKHSPDGPWIVENRYPNPDHPFPDFGATLQVGITAYTDWPTAAPFAGNVRDAYHFNYAPPATGQPDLVAQVDYFRIRRPDPALTEAILEGMSVSYDPATNQTANPPVLLSASAGAAPHLGNHPNHAYDPYGDWQALQFGADAGLPLALPGADPDRDGLVNLLEFFLGGNALQGSRAQAPVMEMVEGSPHYVFTPGIDCGAAAEVAVSGDLLSWTVIASRPVSGGAWQLHDPGTAVEVDAGTGQVRVTLPAGPSSQFVRLGVGL